MWKTSYHHFYVASGKNTQHALIRMTERWRHCLDNSGAIAAVLMDLLKADDCIPHDLLIVKLYASVLDITECIQFAT